MNMNVFEKDLSRTKREYRKQVFYGAFASFFTLGTFRNTAAIALLKKNYEECLSALDDYNNALTRLSTIEAQNTKCEVDGIDISDTAVSLLKYTGSEGYGFSWEEIRRYVLERDHFTCQEKDHMCQGPLHVHHMTELSRGGGNNYSNLVTLCKYHHSRKHAHMRGR